MFEQELSSCWDGRPCRSKVGRNVEGAAVSFSVGEQGPHLTQCRLVEAYLRTSGSWSIQPFGHNTPTLQTDRHQAGQTGQLSRAPQFSAHIYYGQTAGWIKMPLGTEVCLGPGHIVLYGDLALSLKRGTAAPPPLFGPCLLWPNGRPSQLLLSSCSPYEFCFSRVFSHITIWCRALIFNVFSSLCFDWHATIRFKWWTGLDFIRPLKLNEIRLRVGVTDVFGELYSVCD